MSENKEFLATEPVGKLLLKLAVPSVISQLVNMLYNIVDRIYIGHIPKTGSLALTGLGVCMPIIMIISALLLLSALAVLRELQFLWARAKMIQPKKLLETVLPCRLSFQLSLPLYYYPVTDFSSWLSAQAATQLIMLQAI